LVHHEMIDGIEQGAREAVAAMPRCCDRLSGLTYLVAGANMVKIGSSTDLPQRVVALQVSSPVPLRILALGNGTSFEKYLHTALMEYRRHGEWFDLDGVLTELRVPMARMRALRECLACSVLLGPRGTFARQRREAFNGAGL
jgi:hypothetical protein